MSLRDQEVAWGFPMPLLSLNVLNVMDGLLLAGCGQETIVNCAPDACLLGKAQAHQERLAPAVRCRRCRNLLLERPLPVNVLYEVGLGELSTRHPSTALHRRGPVRCRVLLQCARPSPPCVAYRRYGHALSSGFPHCDLRPQPTLHVDAESLTTRGRHTLPPYGSSKKT